MERPQHGHLLLQADGAPEKARIPVYVLFGNYDAESEMTKKLELPDNVFTFETRKPTSFPLPHLKVVLHGRSFKEPATTENLVASYPAPVPGMLNIGVLHTAARISPLSDPTKKSRLKGFLITISVTPRLRTTAQRCYTVSSFLFSLRDHCHIENCC